MLDCGAYDLVTSFEFLKPCPNGKVIAFEPDDVSYNKCLNNKSNHLNGENITVIKAGTGKETTVLSFVANHSGFSHFEISATAIP